jgi:hypothetical protein
LEQHPLYVSWTIRSSRGRYRTYLLELVEESHGTDRTSWELERESSFIQMDGYDRNGMSSTSRDTADAHPLRSAAGQPGCAFLTVGETIPRASGESKPPVARVRLTTFGVRPDHNIYVAGATIRS